MTGCDPSAVDSLLERLRNLRRSDLCGSGQFGGRLVPELADGAVLIDCVLLVADDCDGRCAGQHQRQDDDPGVRGGAASYESRVRGSLSHPLSTLAENRPRRQERPRTNRRAPMSARTGSAVVPHDIARGRTRLTPARLCFFNRGMVPLRRLAAKGAALFLVLALASAGVALHEHDTDVQDAGHADCDACHFRHLSGVQTDGTPAPSPPDLVAHTVVSADPDVERGIALGIRPTRGPPA